MPFFDRMSRAFSETGQKTRDYAGVSRLNSKISENELRIRELQTELGELYCRVHGEDAEPAFSDRVAKIFEMQAQNAAWREEIQSLRGLIRCPGCGAYVANNAPFCASCGRRLLADNAVVCPGCGTVLEQGMIFCRHCGLRLPTQADPEDAEAFVCDCGARLSADTLFCPKCGASVAIMRAARDAGGQSATPEEEPEQPPADSAQSSGRQESPIAACAVCGAPLAPDDEFCRACGAPVSPDGTAQPTASEQPAPAETPDGDEPAVPYDDVTPTRPSAPPRTKRCPHCGAEQKAETLFCEECGTRLN